MRKRRWKRVALPVEEDSEESILGWTLEGYVICLNVNHGKYPPEPGRGKKDRFGDLWWFEVSYEPEGRFERYVGEAPNLKRAKEVAYLDANG